MRWRSRLLLVCATCVVGAGCVLRTAAAFGNEDIVEVEAIPFFEGQPPELYEHLGWADAAFFHCKTSGKNFQVVSAVEVWIDGKPTRSGYTTKKVALQLSDVPPRDVRASISLSQASDERLTIRMFLTTVGLGGSTGFKPLDVRIPDGVEEFLPTKLHHFTLRPGEERVVWAYTGKRRRGGNWGFEMVPDPERDEESIDVSRKEKAEFLIFMKMKLTSWLDD